MSKKLQDYREQKHRLYWHYYFLKRDPDFKADTEKLDNQIAIQLENGEIIPVTGIDDFDYLHDPEKERKIKLIEQFQEKWHIYWHHDLLSYLIRGNKDDIPAMIRGNVGLKTDKKSNLFQATIPFSATKNDIDILWLLIRSEQQDMGIDISKKPHYDIIKRNGEIAYCMWKLRRNNVGWAQIIRVVNEQFKRDFDNDTTAKKFLKSNGLFL